MNQQNLISQFNQDRREPFNPSLFERDDMEIIEELKKVILSSQRGGGFFTIRVESFRVVDDYAEINKLLYDYEETFKKKNKNKNKHKDNLYSYINLKDSDVRLLVVKYFISIQDKSEYIDVYIAVPRVIDRFYMKINGNMYSTMFQIVDGSTYNNLTSNSKYSSVTMKTMFMPIRLYRYSETLRDLDKNNVKCNFYVMRIFNKSLPGVKYFLAKYGLVGTLDFLGLRHIAITKQPLEDKTLHTFKLQNESYLSVPIDFMAADNMTQSLVHSIIKYVTIETNYEDIFSKEFWVSSLGQEFSHANAEKGEAILNSLEGIYDIATKQSIRLPEEDKKDIYDILRWMMREFQYLRQKDNLDISYKKIRLAEYIASLYAIKISKGIYRIADLQKRANIGSIKKAIITHPTYLLSAIDRCNLVNYRNMVNDMDSLTALKCTYKGISGLGENGSNSIPDIYRAINPSHIKRVDLDSSSATDPGITGTLCPYVDIYDGYFSDYTEPNFWETEFNSVLENYNSAIGLKEVAEFKNKVLGSNNIEEITKATEVVATMEQLIKPAFIVDMTTQLDNRIPLEEGGIIYYEHGTGVIQ